MKRIWLRILIAVFTFLIGVGSVYLTWLAYRKPLELPPLDSQVKMENPGPLTDSASTSNTKSVKEEWEELAAADSCTQGLRYYSPDFDSYDPGEVDNPEAGVFHSTRWVAFFRRDQNETVPFLISQIPKRAETHIHIAPFGKATKGELAVYCLQFILKVNWYELRKDYETRFDRIDYGYTTDQRLLQKIIGTRRGAKEMMALWRNVYDRSQNQSP